MISRAGTRHIDLRVLRVLGGGALPLPQPTILQHGRRFRQRLAAHRQRDDVGARLHGLRAAGLAVYAGAMTLTGFRWRELRAAFR